MIDIAQPMEMVYKKNHHDGMKGSEMLIDSHCHLDMKDFDEDRENVIIRARNAGIRRMVAIGIDLESSRAVLKLAYEYPFISATVGCHPHDADTCKPEDLEVLAGMAQDSKVVAWGEIGLDYYRDYSRKENQLQIFEKQLELARSVDLPVVIHDRDAHEDVYAILKKMGKGKGVIHCFSGDKDLADAFMALGYYISIPGTVTYKKAGQVRVVASAIPLERMLVETDAPFLSPVPRRGKRNEPAYVSYTVGRIAEIRNKSFAEIAEMTTRNACELFNLSLAE